MYLVVVMVCLPDTTHLVEYGEGGDDEDGVDAIHDQLKGEQHPECFVSVPEHGWISAEIANAFMNMYSYPATCYLLF